MTKSIDILTKDIYILCRSIHILTKDIYVLCQSICILTQKCAAGYFVQQARQ